MALTLHWALPVIQRWFHICAGMCAGVVRDLSICSMWCLREGPWCQFPVGREHQLQVDFVSWWCIGGTFRPWNSTVEEVVAKEILWDWPMFQWQRHHHVS